MNDFLRLLDQFVKLVIAADVELPESLEELGQIFDGRISEDFRLSIALPKESLSKMLNQFCQFFRERCLGQLDGIIKACRHALAFLFVQLHHRILACFDV